MSESPESWGHDWLSPQSISSMTNVIYQKTILELSWGIGVYLIISRYSSVPTKYVRPPFLPSHTYSLESQDSNGGEGSANHGPHAKSH